ncbi:MAG: IS66 family insertion sequence element accessory protein TnpB [Blautia caecimuris]
MLDLSGGTTVYLACGVTDLRKSYNGLAAIIKLKFHLDPYSRCMFAFCNRRRTSHKDPPMGRIRILDPDETARP